MRNLLHCCLVVFAIATYSITHAQTTVSNPEADNILKGEYSFLDYTASEIISDHQQIICEINENVNADSLEAYLIALGSFSNRHTYSDTVSSTFGIGAARRWVYQFLENVSAANEGRLITSYLNYYQDDAPCETWIGDGPLKNIFAVLPGTDIEEPELIIIAAHLDSRCADPCDIDCIAQGMEDNGSGSAMVLELARVMSKYTFDKTIVFMLTTGEEQGLYGAKAFAQYCYDNSIAIRQMQNNDIVGGIICGETSSPPSCTEPGSIDSLNVRIFANPSPIQMHHNFALYVDYMFREMLAPNMEIPMFIAVQNQEDRTGRGGDHIAFSTLDFTAIRFTSANESGDGAPDADYTDRQHTSDDILGVDTDGDLLIDSFFVSFTYLQRNTIINGMSMALGALAPPTPEIEILDEPEGLKVHILSPIEDAEYRIAVRETGDLFWQYMYRTNSTEFLVPGQTAGTLYFISVAAVNSEGITGLFSREYFKTSDASTDPQAVDDNAFAFTCATAQSMLIATQTSSIHLKCIPNPTTGNTTITFQLPSDYTNTNGVLWISDLRGNMVDTFDLQLKSGENIINYTGTLPNGVYHYSLLLNGKIVASERLVMQH